MKGLIENMKLLLFIVVLIHQVGLNAQTAHYEIVKTIPIGGETHWDYLAVDYTNNHLFVSHGSSVAVIDLSSDSLIREIKNLSGVHGIAFAPEFKKGFISNGRDNSVTVFDLMNLEVTDKINIQGRNPDAILYDSFSKNVFTMNGGSSDASVINAADNKIKGRIPLDGKPEFAVTDMNGKIFVNIEDKNEIQEFDSKTLKVLNTWSILPGEEPTGLAIDTKNNRLFTVCGNKLMVILDSKSGKTLKTLPIGAGADGCAFDSAGQLIFCSNGEGNITVVKEESPDNFAVVDNVATQKGARTIAFDEKTKRIYTDTAIEGENNSKTFSLIVLDRR
jgi:DNA-binding beta-propeller fold protein YncE